MREGKIRLLPEQVIGKIAAGEVVERPVAAIKELVENSLDASATAITVEIRDGGLTSIRVSDNGCGIDESDLRLAFERHATSKLREAKDLDAIATLGFRGEALASIAAVSRVTLTTRTATADIGLRVRNEGGRILDIREAACPRGTTVLVEELFYNVPVRRQFMKKPGGEAAAVTAMLEQMVLSRPDVSFRYLIDGRVVFLSPGDGQLVSALHTLYGRNALGAMRKVDGNANGILLNGYVGIGENARGNRNHEFFFINRRVMSSPLLSSALEDACRERVMIGKYPICALHLEIAYEAVNVNVHPNKLVVRFRDEAAVHDAVFSLVTEALQERDALARPVEMKLTPEKKDQTPVLRENAVAYDAEGGGTVSDAGDTAADPSGMLRIPPANAVVTVEKSLPGDWEPKDCRAEMVEEPLQKMKTLPDDSPACSKEKQTIEKTDRSLLDPIMFSEPQELHSPFAPEPEAEQLMTELPEVQHPLEIIGTVFNTFILIEYEDHLLLVDQHAVHERLLFDRLMREHGQGQQMGQTLLIPLLMTVTRQEQQLLEENREMLHSVGLEAEPFGEHDISIRTIPMVLGEAQTKEYIRDLLAELEAGKALGFERKREKLLQTACKHAVKGGERLGEEVLRDLVQQMIDQKVTPTCPHGRPLVVSISHRELDRKFKRIQE